MSRSLAPINLNALRTLLMRCAGDTGAVSKRDVDVVMSIVEGDGTEGAEQLTAARIELAIRALCELRDIPLGTLFGAIVPEELLTLLTSRRDSRDSTGLEILADDDFIKVTAASSNNITQYRILKNI